jgi:hypothetical protein
MDKEKKSVRPERPDKSELRGLVLGDKNIVLIGSIITAALIVDVLVAWLFDIASASL